MSCTNAVRKDPKQQDFHTNDTGSNQRSEKNAHIAEQVTSCFHPHHLLSSFRLIHHPWIYLIVTNNSCHSYYSFKSKRVATDELQISSQWFRWIIQINRFTTQFGILWRIVCKSMMRPMKTPKPFGSAEVFEAKRDGRKSCWRLSSQRAVLCTISWNPLKRNDSAIPKGISATKRRPQ